MSMNLVLPPISTSGKVFLYQSPMQDVWPWFLFLFFSKDTSSTEADILSVKMRLSGKLRRILVFSVQFSLVTQSCLTLVTPWTAARQSSQSITNSRTPFKLMSIVPVLPSNHLILCHPLLIPPSIFPSINVFSKKSVLCIRWPKDWSFSFSIASVVPMNIQDRFPLWWTHWISLLSRGLSEVYSNTAVQKHQFFSAQVSSQSNSHIHTWPLEKP